MKPRGVHYAMVAPLHLLLLLVILLPSLFVFWLSLNSSELGRDPSFVGLRNYAAVLGDPQFWTGFRNTFVLVNVVVYAELLVGLGMALLFAAGVPARPVLIAIVLAPYAISEVVAVTTWKYALDPTIGLFTQGLNALGLPALDWSVSPAAALVLVAVISVWLHLPFTFILLYTARLALPSTLYEAAEIDGASPWRQFRAITLPLLVPTILTAVLFRLIIALRMFSEVWLLTEGGPARTTELIAVFLYKQAFRYHDFGGAAATGWLLVIASLALSLYYLRQIHRQMLVEHA